MPKVSFWRALWAVVLGGRAGAEFLLGPRPVVKKREVYTATCPYCGGKFKHQ